MECFCEDFDTVLAAKIVGMSRQKLTKYYGAFRFRIFALSQNPDKLSGEVEIIRIISTLLEYHQLLFLFPFFSLLYRNFLKHRIAPYLHTRIQV